MPAELPSTYINLLLGAVVVAVAWYLYQISSRKTGQIRFQLNRAGVALVAYAATAYVLVGYKVPPLEAAIASAFVGMGAGWLFVKSPNRTRRIPQSVRRKVIERDLTSKGLKWDPAKYDIDHIVPYSRGGDHSERNLRVTEKTKNRRKGRKMPGVRDLLR